MKRRSLIFATVAVVAVSGLIYTLTRPVDDDVVEWVALGDSYAAGEGLTPYLDESCHRSNRGYPERALSLLGDSDRIELVNRACGGATALAMVDGRSTQLDAITRSTDLVTLTIGGNDLGFAQIIVQCTLTTFLPVEPCNIDDDEAESRLDETRRRIEAVLSAIRDRSAGASIVVVGYPVLISSERRDGLCADLTGVAERRRAESLALGLDERLRAASAAQGARFVSVVDLFEGHDVCASEPWVNPFVFELGGDLALAGSTASYHPTDMGTRVYGQVLAPLIAEFMAAH